jgi:tetratricopeptide (TPR) repeat protein
MSELTSHLALFHRGQYELAIFEYRGALNCPGGHRARARFNIGICNHRLGRTREAVADYRAVIQLREGQYPSASYALGITLQGLQRYREAREAFAQAVKSSGGKHADALFELALESQRDGADRAAFDHYRQAVGRSNDRIPACHNNLGVILAKAGMLEESIREFELAVTRSRGKLAEASHIPNMPGEAPLANKVGKRRLFQHWRLARGERSRDDQRVEEIGRRDDVTDAE